MRSVRTRSSPGGGGKGGENQGVGARLAERSDLDEIETTRTPHPTPRSFGSSDPVSGRAEIQPVRRIGGFQTTLPPTGTLSTAPTVRFCALRGGFETVRADGVPST